MWMQVTCVDAGDVCLGDVYVDVGNVCVCGSDVRVDVGDFCGCR